MRPHPQLVTGSTIPDFIKRDWSFSGPGTWGFSFLFRADCAFCVLVQSTDRTGVQNAGHADGQDRAGLPASHCPLQPWYVPGSALPAPLGCSSGLLAPFLPQKALLETAES